MKFKIFMNRYKKLFNNNEIDYVFVINSDNCSINIPVQSNIKIINRDNSGRDFAAWSEALNIINKDKYDYFIFINGINYFVI